MVQYVFAVAGAKGGVGKTTTSINLGTALAELGWSVVVVETDVAMANVLDFLHVDVDPYVEATLHDVLRGDAAAMDAVYEAPGGIDVLPSGIDLEGFAAADVQELEGSLRDLRSTYDVVLLDTGAGLSRETLYPLALADATILVTSPRVAAVRDTEKTKRLTTKVGGTVEGVVFVESGTGTAPPSATIADFLGVDLLGEVPEDDAVPISQDAGEPVVSSADGSEAASAYRRIARELQTTILAGSDAGTGPSASAPGRTEQAGGDVVAGATDAAPAAAAGATDTPDGTRNRTDGAGGLFVGDAPLAHLGIEEADLAADEGVVGDAISELWETAVLERDEAEQPPPDSRDRAEQTTSAPDESTGPEVDEVPTETEDPSTDAGQDDGSGEPTLARRFRSALGSLVFSNRS